MVIVVTFRALIARKGQTRFTEFVETVSTKSTHDLLGGLVAPPFELPLNKSLFVNQSRKEI